MNAQGDIGAFHRAPHAPETFGQGAFARMETRRALFVNHGAAMGKRVVRRLFGRNVRPFLRAEKPRRNPKAFQVRQNLRDLRLFRGDGLGIASRVRPHGSGERFPPANPHHPLFLSGRPRRKFSLHLPLALRLRDGIVFVHRGLVSAFFRGTAFSRPPAALLVFGLPRAGFDLVTVQNRGSFGVSGEIVRRSLSRHVRVFRDPSSRRRVPLRNVHSHSGRFRFGDLGAQRRNRPWRAFVAQARFFEKNRRQRRFPRSREILCEGLLERGAFHDVRRNPVEAPAGRGISVLPKFQTSRGRPFADVL